VSADEQLLERVRATVAGAAASLNASVGRLNDLNVYPVPDGDTGTNLARTVHAVVEALDRAAPGDGAVLARAVSRAALMGARGNSGIILSQVVRGLCERLGESDGLDAAIAAAALRNAADVAYRAVRQPVEGTMLTVIREMAEAGEAAHAAGEGLDETLDAALEQGEDALARTPTMLAILREAGVVDAGGAGLCELVRGALAGLRNEELRLPAAAPPVSIESIHQEASRYRYCTNYLVEGPGVDAGLLERRLAALGDSLVVVGDGQVAKVHVHTDDPGHAISLATAMGAIEGVDVADMHRQAEERTARLEARPALSLVVDPDVVCDAVCVVAGEGNRQLVEQLGARVVVEGGQTMNPSTGELLEAIAACPAPQVVLLPNNSNVILAAEIAAAEADRVVVVVPTRSIPAGLSAMITFKPGESAERNAAAMREALGSVRTGEVTLAVRDSTADGVAIRKGDYLALLDGQVVASVAAPEQAVREVAERLLSQGGEVLTVLRGDASETGGIALEQTLDELAAAHPQVEIEVHDGGQPHYPVLLAAE
jgi:DAK2 domain fusion protein YloV